MAIKTRANIGLVFEQDDFPTAQDFTDWRESFFHLTEDALPAVKLDGTTTEYDSDADAVTAGLTINQYYLAGSSHIDGVRQGTPCRVNNI